MAISKVKAVKKEVKVDAPTYKESDFYKDKYGNIHGPAIETPVGRAMYVNLAEPNMYNPEKPSYGLTLIFDKDEVGQEFEDACVAITGLASIVTSRHAKPKAFDTESWLKDGDGKLGADGEQRAEFENKWYINLNNSKQFICWDRQEKKIPFDFIQGGMKVRCLAKVVASTPSGVPKVSLKPQVCQFVEDDGTRIGGPVYSGRMTKLDDVPKASKISSPAARPNQDADEDDGEDSMEDAYGRV